MSHFLCGCHGLEAMLRRAHRENERAFPLPGDEVRWGPPRPFSVEALTIRVSLDLDARRIDGDCEIWVRQVDIDAKELVLDAVDFEIRKVQIRQGSDRWDALPFRYDDRELRIDLSNKNSLTEGRARVRVEYGATPRRGLYFVTRRPLRAAEDPHARPTEVWSQGQDRDNRHWFPCIDHPNQRMRTEMIATVPKGFFALSNGTLVSRTPAGQRETFHWRQDDPHPSYLVTLACGEFDEAHALHGALPIDYYVPKGDSEHIERSLGRTPQMIRLFEEKLGTPFPWAKYAQVVVSDFIFGGMENTSATTLFDRVLLDERAALDVDMDSLVAHELAHQWFGDLVTCRDWSHAWLNEGFATYLEHVWREHAEGLDAYHYGLEQDLDAYLDEDRDRYRRPIVTNTWSAPIDLFDRHLYQKGGLTLHALRMHLGDGPFWSGIRAYLGRMRGQSAETRDLLRAMEDATGRSLEAFFDRWVMKSGHPDLEISGEYREGVVELSIAQTQATPTDSSSLFAFELLVIVVTEAGSQEHRLQVTQPRETFALRSEKPPTMVVVDPHMHVHGTFDNRLGTSWLAEQLASAERASPRWRAARALAKRNEPRAQAALAKGLSSDPFWAVRAECASALGEQSTPAALDALLAARHEHDPRVRRSVAAALGRFRAIAPGDSGTRASGALISWIEEGDRSYLVESELRRALGRTRAPHAFEVLRERFASDPPTWADVMLAGTVDGLAFTRDKRAIPLLLEALGGDRAPSVRRAALAALGRSREVLHEESELVSIREAIEQTMDAFDPGVRISACRALVNLGDHRGVTAIGRLIDRDMDGRVKRAARESARDLQSREPEREVSSLRDELEKMRVEFREIKHKLAILEARTKSGDSKES